VSALVFGRIAFDIGPRKLVVFRIDRRELPHVTFSWNNPSGEVDLHLTPISACGPSDRQSLLRIRESELPTRFRDLVARVLTVVLRSPVEMVWGCDARWLAANGYLLLGPTSEPIKDWWVRAFAKRRGKYRLDERVFKKMPRMGARKPTGRTFATLGAEGQMYAVCTKGPQRGRVLMLARLDFGPSHAAWIACDFSDLIALVRTLQSRRVLWQWFSGFAPGVWETLHAALQLHELER